jgi:tetratricopeptide (TPR) repeat protein
MKAAFVIAAGLSVVAPTVAVAGHADGADEFDDPGLSPSDAAPDPTPSSTKHQQPTPEAVRVYDEGLRQFRAGSYDKAIELLKAAYDQAPVPTLLYDLGQAYRLKGDCAQALGAYQRFLATGPAGRARTLTEARVTDMQRCRDRSADPTGAPRSPESAGIRQQGVSDTTAGSRAVLLRPVTPLGIGSLPASTPVDSTPRLITVSHPPSDDGTTNKAFRRRAGATAGAVAVILGASSGYFAWRASEMSDQVSDAFTPGRTWEDARASDRAGRWDDRLALATGAAALVAAGITAWMLWK